MTSPRPFDLSLYLVFDPNFCKPHSPLMVLESALKSGVSMVQYRSKAATPDLELIKACQKLCHDSEIPFILNDDPELAVKIDADGCHVGTDDTPALDARTILGEHKILGITVRTTYDMEKAITLARLQICDYVGIGAVFPSSSKALNARTPLGIKGLAQYVAHFRSQLEVHLPLCAISGINRKNVDKVRATGVDGIAVISAVCGAINPSVATRALSLSPKHRAGT